MRPVSPAQPLEVGGRALEVDDQSLRRVEADQAFLDASEHARGQRLDRHRQAERAAEQHCPADLRRRVGDGAHGLEPVGEWAGEVELDVSSAQPRRERDGLCEVVRVRGQHGDCQQELEAGLGASLNSAAGLGERPCDPGDGVVHGGVGAVERHLEVSDAGRGEVGGAPGGRQRPPVRLDLHVAVAQRSSNSDEGVEVFAERRLAAHQHELVAAFRAAVAQGRKGLLRGPLRQPGQVADGAVAARVVARGAEAEHEAAGAHAFTTSTGAREPPRCSLKRRPPASSRCVRP